MSTKELKSILALVGILAVVGCRPEQESNDLSFEWGVYMAVFVTRSGLHANVTDPDELVSLCCVERTNNHCFNYIKEKRGL